MAVTLEGATVTAIDLHEDFATILADSGEEPVGVDMPIGLPTDAPRRADVLARQRLGRRASSVFTTPPREALTAPDHSTASDLARERIGVGISIQAWNIRGAVLELDDLDLPARVLEIHPELCFAVLAEHLSPGTPLDSKRRWRGLSHRLLLLRELSIDLLDVPPAPDGAIGPDDVVDATVVAWAAAGAPTGELQRLPETGGGAGAIHFRIPPDAT